MKITVSKKKFTMRADQFLKQYAGYAHIHDRHSGHDSYVRRLTRDHYPRFHVYLKELDEIFGPDPYAYGIKANAKAIEMLDQGLVLYPENVEMLFRAGVVHDKWGNKDQSIRIMQKVIALEPDNATALNYLGYTYADLGMELELAESLIKKAMALNPDDGYITDSLGWVYYRKADYTKAIEYLERALELSSHDPVVAEHLGDAYQKVNNPEKALEIYKKALKKATTNKEDLIKKIKTLEETLHD